MTIPRNRTDRCSFNPPRAGLEFQNLALHINNPTLTHMKVISSFLALLALSAITSFAAEGDAPKKPDGDKGKPKMNPEARFKMLDKDGNGSISKEEWMASPMGKKDATKAGEMFTRMDKDSDGSLTKEEMAAAGKKKKDA